LGTQEKIGKKGDERGPYKKGAAGGKASPTEENITCRFERGDVLHERGKELRSSEWVKA